MDLTSGYIKGIGTSSDPLKPGPRTQAIIKVLIDNPRATPAQIQAVLKEKTLSDRECFKNPRDFRDWMLSREGERLAELLTFRLNIAELRHGLPEEDVGGTCLLSVSVDAGEFFKDPEATRAAISTIYGVIEWDELTGDTDFLVRVADKSGGVLAKSVISALYDVPCVEKVKTINIRKSVIVDNFDPEHFLHFAEK